MSAFKNDQELAHGGDERELLGLTGGTQPAVTGAKRQAPAADLWSAANACRGRSSAGVFEDVHAGTPAVDQVQAAVLVGADVVRLNGLLAAGSTGT
jgi:hypothetical protein